MEVRCEDCGWVVAVALSSLPGASERKKLVQLQSANKKWSAATFSDRMHASFAPPPVALKVGGGGVGCWRLAEIDGAWTDGGTGGQAT